MSSAYLQWWFHSGERVVARGPLVSSPEHEVLMVSYCGQLMSIVCRLSCVVHRAASTIALKAYSSYTPGPIDSILGRKHWVTCRSKTAKIILIGNPRWPPS